MFQLSATVIDQMNKNLDLHNVPETIQQLDDYSVDLGFDTFRCMEVLKVWNPMAYIKHETALIMILFICMNVYILKRIRVNVDIYLLFDTSHHVNLFCSTTNYAHIRKAKTLKENYFEKLLTLVRAYNVMLIYC